MQGDATDLAWAAVGQRGGGQQVHHHGALNDLDAWVIANGIELGDERAADLGSGGVAACVHDAVAVVAALARERDVAVRGGVEVRAARHEFADSVGAFGDERAHGLLAAQPRPGNQGVVEVLLRGVFRIQRGGDAALRPHR